MSTTLSAPSPSLTRVGIDKIVLGDAKKVIRFANQFCNFTSLKQRFEKRFGLAYQGMPTPKPEGTSLVADQMRVIGEKDYQPIMYASRYDVTLESQQADLYNALAKAAQSRAIGKQFAKLENYEFCNVLNNQSQTSVGSRSYTGIDGVALVSHSHPTASGTFSNRGDGASDIALNQFNVETGIQRLALQVDYNGTPATYNGGLVLWCHPSRFMQTKRIVESAQLQGTSDNDENAIKQFVEKVIHFGAYSTSTTRWGLIPTSKEDTGIFGLEFIPMGYETEKDGMALTWRCNHYRSFGIYFDWWQNIWGTEGA